MHAEPACLGEPARSRGSVATCAPHAPVRRHQVETVDARRDPGCGARGENDRGEEGPDSDGAVSAASDPRARERPASRAAAGGLRGRGVVLRRVSDRRERLARRVRCARRRSRRGPWRDRRRAPRPDGPRRHAARRGRDRVGVACAQGPAGGGGTRGGTASPARHARCPHCAESDGRRHDRTGRAHRSRPSRPGRDRVPRAARATSRARARGIRTRGRGVPRGRRVRRARSGRGGAPPPRRDAVGGDDRGRGRHRRHHARRARVRDRRARQALRQAVAAPLRRPARRHRRRRWRARSDRRSGRDAHRRLGRRGTAPGPCRRPHPGDRPPARRARRSAAT